MTDTRTIKDKTLSTQFLHEAFLYKDGRLYWKQRPAHHFSSVWRQRIFNSCHSFTEAGNESTLGYRYIRFQFGNFSVHRIIFIMHNGYIPEVVDHIDGNARNNLISNLRAATRSQNCQNVKTYTTNTSGRKGVSFHKGAKKWVAYIRVKEGLKHLGSFVDFEDAKKARESAERFHYGEFSNVR